MTADPQPVGAAYEQRIATEYLEQACRTATWTTSASCTDGAGAGRWTLTGSLDLLNGTRPPTGACSTRSAPRRPALGSIMVDLRNG
jgi:hypothetical protein